MLALPISTGLQSESGNAYRTCCDGLCNQGRDCPLSNARLRNAFATPAAPGRLGSKPASTEQPLTQGWLIFVGTVAVATVVLLALAVFGAGYLVGSAQYDRAPAAKPARVMT